MYIYALLYKDPLVVCQNNDTAAHYIGTFSTDTSVRVYVPPSPITSMRRRAVEVYFPPELF